MIPIEQIKAASLTQARSLLSEWFPAGRVVGHEFMIGNLDGDAGSSLSVNLNTGIWKDFAAGDVAGSNLVELRAQAHHRGDFHAAAVEVGQQLGVYLNGHAKADMPKRNGAHKRADTWKAMIPPPPGAAPPDASHFRGYNTYWEYTDLTGRVTHYVRRRDNADGSKDYHPLTYGVLNDKPGWHSKRPTSWLPLYGLNRLAALPNANVLLCEGEKAADAAQRMFPEWACVAYYGGTGSVGHADLYPLQGRWVIVWPDADDAGQKAAQKLSQILRRAPIVDVSDLPDGWDAADISPDDPQDWLLKRLPRSQRPEQQEDPWDADETGASNESTLDPAIAESLSAFAWANLDIPPETRLLGDLITASTRMFLVGSTGLGKTLFAYGLVGGMAGKGEFLHWKGDRPSKWLIIDGEMPTGLVKARAADMIRRAGGNCLKPHNIMIYSRDRAEEFARLFPSLGQMQPLNTEAGHQFIKDLIAAVGGVDGILFDNVMSLAPGDQKDEDVWAGCVPLVDWISGKSIAQIWCDHTGHNTGRQYGSNTKSWRFDAVGLMTPLTEMEQPIDHTAFKLSFDSPGKARRRTPDNWRDFETCIIRLIDDKWIADPASQKREAPREAKLSSENALMLAEIRNVLGRHGEPFKPEKGAAELVRVLRTGVRTNLIAAGWYPEDMLRIASHKVELLRRAYTKEHHALTTLKRNNFIDFNREYVWQP